MPRVRAGGATSNAPATATTTTPHKSGIKIPLNDDREEKAKRLQSRQAFHEMHINSLKAAASPARKRKSLGPDLHDGPQTPRENGSSQDDDGGFYVGGNAVTPMKRVPILANFEEWMKMATDNKINATNSWNFALIDYFHDMSLLREGDGVNFQKASCTLDGCVKIYTSRVDSVATETGKLLSGLADSGNKKQRGGDADQDGEDGDEEEEGEDGVKRKTKKKSQRSSEATLATSFAQLQLKKMELEFSVDPLFKKASADFDEGGAKGLLLNHLSIDNTGRIVFDSSDDAQDDDESRRDSMLEEIQEKPEEDTPAPPPAQIDISGLAARFFPDLSKLDSQDVCPSMKTFELGGGTASLDLPFLKAPEDWRQQKEEEDDHDDARSGIVLDEENAMGFDDDDGAFGGFDIPVDAGFGEGGEAWARDAHIEPQLRPHDVGADLDAGVGAEVDGGEVGGFDSNSNQYGVTLAHRGNDDHDNILSYFDQALQKNWAGPEHWKIKKIKDAAKAAPTASKKKEKEPFEIDFSSPMSQQLADLLYTPAASNAAISLPKKDWKSKTRNLLPDDKHFSSRDLLRLFLKPKARIGARKSGQQQRNMDNFAHADVDEAYWAKNQGPAEQQPLDEAGARGDYDANFFQDDGLGVAGAGADDDDDDDFADAQEMLPAADAFDAAQTGVPDGFAPPSSQETAFGSNLITQSRRMRPEYVQYARVAKKIDVRRLKEEMWRGIGYEEPSQTPTAAATTPQKSDIPTVTKTEEGTLKFTDVINNLQHVYPKQQMRDISTSFCFICLLHLANEKGLVIENQEGFEELVVRRDFAADVSDQV